MRRRRGKSSRKKSVLIILFYRYCLLTSIPMSTRKEVRERDPSTQYTELEVGTDQLAQKHPPNLTGKDVCVMAAAFPSEQLITPNVG